MFKRLLVPLDGSTRAEKAIPVAARIAHASGGTIVLLQVVDMPIRYGKFVTPTSFATEKDVEAEKAQATEYLTALAQSDELEGIGTKIEVESAAVAPALLNYAQPSTADLMVMCSHGYTGFKRWTLGSIADKVIRHAAVPVLLLRENGPTIPVPQSTAPLRALVALDGSPLSEAIIEPVAHLVAALSPQAPGALHLLRVADSPATSGRLRSQANLSDAMAEELKKEAQDYLASMAKRLQDGIAKDLNLSITTSVVSAVDIAEAIIHEAEKTEGTGGYALIAMSTHGRGGLERWTAGSVTERTLHHTKLPLFIIRPSHSTPGTETQKPAEKVKEESTAKESAQDEVTVIEVKQVEVETWTN